MPHTSLLQLFSLREHLLAVEKQRDAKAAEAFAWAARTQEVQEEADNQLSYQQIEIQALHQRSHVLAHELQVRACLHAAAAAGA